MEEKWTTMTNEELCTEYQQTNNEKLFDYFLSRNIGLIYNFMHPYISREPWKKEDFIGRGKMAFWKATRKFDSSRGSFSTYLYFFLRKEIIFEKLERIRFHIPFNMLKDYQYKAKDNGTWINQVLSTEQILNADDDSNSDKKLLDTIADETQDYNYDQFSENQYLLQLVDRLPARQKAMVTEYFGLKDGIPKTLQMLGDKYGVTRERIRQIVAKGIKKLRIYYENNIE